MHEKNDFKLKQGKLADALGRRIQRVTDLKAGDLSKDELYRKTESEITRRTDIAYGDDAEQNVTVTGGPMTGQASRGLQLRKKLYRIPVLGQLLRIARHVYFLPRLVENDMPRMIRQMQEQSVKVDQFAQGMAELDALIDGASGLHRKADQALEARDAMLDWQKTVDERLNRFDSRVEDVVSANGFINRKLIRLAEERAAAPTQVVPSADGAGKALSPEDVSSGLQELYQDFYTRLENRYRGSRDDIKARQSVYLPDLAAARERTGDAGVLDIGCGRGEFIELLKENGYRAQGVDLNEVQVSVARDLGLDAVEGDGLRLLKESGKDSLTAVTALHVIEHISFELMLQLFTDALEALKPGGVAIFETPDPENLVVGANTFYFDPTHVRPLPSELVSFAMEYAGFSDVEVRRLHPKAEYDAFMADQNKDPYVTELIFGPQDYAVIGRKRAAS